MNSKHYLLFFFLFGFAGCKKIPNDQVDATIYVKEYKTHKSVPHAMVIITKGSVGSGIGSIPVETLYTNAEGKVSYNSSIDNNYMYYAEAWKSNYFNTHNEQVSVTRGKKDF